MFYRLSSAFLILFTLFILSSCERDINVNTKNSGHFLALFHLITEDDMILTNYSINVYYSNESYIDRIPDYQWSGFDKDQQIIIPFENPNFWVEFYFSNEDGTIVKLNGEDKFAKPRNIKEGALTEYIVTSYTPKISLTYFDRKRNSSGYIFRIFNTENQLLWEREFDKNDTLGKYYIDIPYVFLDDELIIQLDGYSTRTEYYEPYFYIGDTSYIFKLDSYNEFVFGQNVKLE